MSTLRLLTDRAWMRDELARNTVLPVAAAFGYEIPAYEPGDVWWIPQGIATRFLLNGVPLHAQAPGPWWLDGIGYGALQRTFSTLTMDELNSVKDMYRYKPHFYKFAEAKVDWFPAGLKGAADARRLLAEHTVPDDAVLQVGQPIRLGNEYRFFVRDGAPVASSIYLLRHEVGSDEYAYTYYDIEERELTVPHEEQREAEAFLRAALPSISGPDGYVIDVGFKDGTTPVILEANPAWCSAWYGCDIDEVVRTIIAAHQPSDRWRWAPDAYLLAHYAGMRALPRA
jgi:hypothetical protein